ncbi:MAG: TRAP transporter large permease [Thermodesulfobacteriota bacterium]
MLGIALLTLIILLALSVPVAAGLGILGLVLEKIYSNLPLNLALGEISWATSNNFLLVAIPFFVLLGEILLRSGIAERMYNSLVLWVPWLPGGLMHTNIAACAMFAATSGSSVATAATIGTIALGEIKKRGYSERLFLGTIAAGGTLGILIPPSINMIVYGVLTETSIPKLYLAGFIPGVILASLFSLTTLICCLIKPEWGGQRTSAAWGERLRALPDLIPPIIVFISIIGSIYAGWATATESAALGVIAALAIAASRRLLSIQMLKNAFEGTMRTTAMIMAILIAAYFLNFVMGSIGLLRKVNDLILGLKLSPGELLFGVIVFYVILGMFMETLSMMVATVPIITPIMVKVGFDPVWFGVLIVILIETAMITPPVGINLYVVQGLRKSGKINDVIIGALPFVLAMFAMLAIISFWPNLVLWLPQVLERK